ncbi:hypothetical protein EDD22DRAFT_853061 [Suillus occidentalis]|nr:hypothetical protein EDD22DRAFT_853061 [Suillus occidentalis]
MSETGDNSQLEVSSQATQPAATSSIVVPTSDIARHRRRIADLEEKLQVLESGHVVKQRETNYFMSQGRAIRRMVSLYDSIEDLINENDRRCENDDGDVDVTLEQGVDSARGDNTSKLKVLVPDWINREWKPDPPVDPEDKHCRGFTRYTADPNNLEQGLFKSKLLVQAFKAIFTSPSSAKEVMGDGDSANIIENNRRAKEGIFRQESQNSCGSDHKNAQSYAPLNSHMCQCQFWCNIMDFFEHAPGRIVRHSSDQLLAWWTRKVFGTSHQAELSDAAKAKMLVNALMMQRAQLDDAQFNSDLFMRHFGHD